jgi:predicted alpha/beta hydrolase family esterase
LLVAPPDTERADTPPQLCGWRPIPRQRLPFPASVLFSDDDPFCVPERARELAAAWGAQAHGVGRAGHVNGESGLEDWPAGLAHLECLRAPGPDR